MLLFVASALAAPLASFEKDAGEPVWITNVAVFDGETGAITGPHDVWLADGEIARIAPAGSAPRGEPAVDGTGDTLIPGLIDLHVHIGAAQAFPGRLPVPDPADNLRAMVYCGVTTVLDLSEDTAGLSRWNRRTETRIAGPALYGSGRPFGAPKGHPVTSIQAMYPSFLVKLVAGSLSLQVVSEDDVDDAWEADHGRDVVKVMIDDIPLDVPTIGDVALRRVVEDAHEDGLLALAHVGAPDDVDRALAAGVDALAHLPYAGALSDEQIAALAFRTPVIATLAVWQGSEEVTTGSSALDPLEAEVLSGRQERDIARAAAGKAPVTKKMQPWAENLVAHHDDRVSNVRRLHEAGATLLVGTDMPNLGLAPGAGMHHELDLLREQAGMTAAEALAAATWKNSRFLDPDARFGAIREGWEADLVLVDGDPVADPSAVHRIREVWVDGRRVERRGR